MFALRILHRSARIIQKLLGDEARFEACDGQVSASFVLGPDVSEDNLVYALQAVRAAAVLSRDHFRDEVVFTLTKGRLSARFKPGVEVPDDVFEHCDSVEQETP